MEAVITKPPREPLKYSYLNLAEPELGRRVERVLSELSAGTARPSVDAFLHRALKLVPLETLIPRTRQPAVVARLPQPQQELLRGLADSVTSRQKMSISEAKAFVDRMVGTRQIDPLCVALFTLPTEQAQGLAAAGLASLKDPRGVPALVIRLGQAAALWFGGSESERQRKELRRALAVALGTLTGLNVSRYLTSPAVTLIGANGKPSDGQPASLDLIAQVHSWLKTSNGRTSGLGEAIGTAEDEPPKPPVAKVCPTVVSVAVHSSDADTHKVSSVLLPSKSPLDHFVTVKGVAGDIVLVATLSPAAACADIAWEADGAVITSPAIAGNRCTAKLSRATSKKIPVRIKCDARVLWQGVVWVVFSTPNAIAVAIVTGAGTITTGDGTSGPGFAVRGAPSNFRFAITPPEIITDADHPDLTCANYPDNVPNGTSTYVLSGDPLSGGAHRKWDVSRRTRMKILNPKLYPTAQLLVAGGHFWAGQPTATSVPENFPANPIAGNDDAGTTDEVNNPYESPAAGSPAGSLISIDAPTFGMRNSTGSDGDTFEVRFHFGEFARLELGTKWYRISDFNPWRVHFRFKKTAGAWTDNVSVGAPNNTGF